MLKPKIVIIEDDVKLQKMLSDYLEKQGFNVICDDNGLTAGQTILDNNPALVLLDLMLPGQDGLTICRQIRDKFQGKILMLTASDDDFDHVAALETGMDDFLVKPVKPRILLAHMRMLLRRSEDEEEQSSTKGNIKHFGQLEVNHQLHRCLLGKHEVNLSDSEFELLWLLINSKEVLSRNALTQKLRGIEYDGLDRSIDNKIVSLRKKLNDQEAKGILTVRGKGYLFVPDQWDN